jgi:hypothetical protein
MYWHTVLKILYFIFMILISFISCSNEDLSILSVQKSIICGDITELAVHVYRGRYLEKSIFNKV